MTKTIFEEMGGTYRQVGDYLLPNITVPAEEEIEPIGLWGKRHARHLKEHYKVLYMNLLTSGKLHSYLAEVDKHADLQGLTIRVQESDMMSEMVSDMGAVLTGTVFVFIPTNEKVKKASALLDT